MVWNMRPLPKERIENLAANERVVNDRYRDIRGIVWMRERITAEPNDHGRKCEPDGYLADVLEEVVTACVDIGYFDTRPFLAPRLMEDGPDIRALADRFA